MTRKKAFYTGLSFGIMMTIWGIIQSIIFKEGNDEINWIKAGISALVGGLIGGLTFGLLIRWFANSKVLQPKTRLDLPVGETLLFETGANHFKGWEGVGGQLYLTDKNLIFKSHRFNIQKHQLSIPLAGIAEVQRYKALLFSNNGLLVITKSGSKEKCVVQQLEEWLHKLTAYSTGLVVS